MKLTGSRAWNVFAVFICCTNVCFSDGVLEINQACALNGGCFSGDDGDFPVTITEPGSYRLTGNLDLSSFPNTNGIEIDSPYVTLDLNGFEIAGPVTCTGSGSTINCGTPASGDGIQLNNGSVGSLIRNGTVRNMDGSGVNSNADRLTMSHLRAYNNARNGLRSGTGSIATDCVAEENAGDGFDFGVASVIERSTSHANGENGFFIEFQKGVIKNSTARFNGMRGFSMGHSGRFRDNTSDLNQLGDQCGGGKCSAARRFFLTLTDHDGANALSACPNGFHMASITEFQLPSDLIYDRILGETDEDSGDGAPAAPGWMRTGSGSSSTSNCMSWTSNSVSDDGVIVSFANPDTWSSAAIRISPFVFLSFSCSVSFSVWCVED